MSYKIYTYKDPYHLEKTFFWKEICNLPHFCASSVMAQSLWDLYHVENEDSGFCNFFFPLDMLVRATYKDWDGNIERQIHQYAALSDQLREWEKKDGGKRPELFSALLQNRSSLLDALRLFCELNIDPESLRLKLANKEQQVFVLLYKYICEVDGDPVKTQELVDAFSLSDERVHNGQFFPALLEKALFDERKQLQRIEEKEDGEEKENAFRKRDERIKVLEEMEKDISIHPVRKIVIHGIHQFKPLQLRLIAALNSAGFEIIFLYNYLPEYHHLYETWERIYSLFEVPIQRDLTEITHIPLEGQTKESSMLARALAGVLNAEAPVSGEDRRQWMEIAGKVGYIPFENTSEMANYVAEILKEYKDPDTPNERVMYKLPEKIYSASKGADDLLKVYFPEYAGDRHFLQYPVGQFFTCLYQMWNEDIKQLELDVMSLKTCAVSGILNQTSGVRLSEMFDLVSPMLEDVSLYEDVRKRLVDYKDAYNEAETDGLKKQLQNVSLYNESQITPEDIDALLNFLKQLKEAAEFIFNSQEHQNFGEHFANLEEYIKDRVRDLADEEEKKLVQQLLDRFEEVAVRTELKGTMEDLRRGLYYYLSQKREERPGWVVRNFEQIEGDVLRSYRQVKTEKDVTYHFAGLSDGAICKKADDILPWPLTDHFTHVVYSPVAMVFQVYYAALCDRQSYMQYALFYGLFYNRGKVRLSFVRHLEDRREEQLYYPLQILNIQKEQFKDTDKDKSTPSVLHEEPDMVLSDYNPKRYEKMDFYLCPYRYYLDFVCSDGIFHSSAFMIRRFYVSLISNLVRKRHQKEALSEENIRSAVKTIQLEMDKYFPFLQNINDKPDMCETAVSYINEKVVDKNTGRISDYQTVYAGVRERFINALFTENVDEHRPHPIEEMRDYVDFDYDHIQYKGTQKPVSQEEKKHIYSLMRINKENSDDPSFAKAWMARYLQTDLEHKEHEGKWCGICRYKELCKKPYTRALEE